MCVINSSAVGMVNITKALIMDLSNIIIPKKWPQMPEKHMHEFSNKDLRMDYFVFIKWFVFQILGVPAIVILFSGSK